MSFRIFVHSLVPSVLALVLHGCYNPAYQSPPNLYQPQQTQRLGPVGVAAAGGNYGGGQAFLPPSAGQSQYAGSGFDPATHPQIQAEYMARTTFITGSAQAGQVTVPNGTTVVSGGNSNGSVGISTLSQQIVNLHVIAAHENVRIANTQREVHQIQLQQAEILRRLQRRGNPSPAQPPTLVASPEPTAPPDPPPASPPISAGPREPVDPQ